MMILHGSKPGARSPSLSMSRPWRDLTPADPGGVVEFAVRSGVSAVVAAISFARTAALVSALELPAGDMLAHRRYAEQMQASSWQIVSTRAPSIC
jgi:hypothetical protein